LGLTAQKSEGNDGFLPKGKQIEGIRMCRTWIYVTPMKLCDNNRNLQTSTTTSIQSIRPEVLIKKPKQAVTVS